jgi:Ras GTPase-activating protein 3
LAIEKLQEESFKMKYMFQIVQKDRALYIQANNCVEEKEWIHILSKVCQTNRNRLQEYHPSAFIGNQWLCCKATSETATGCCPVSCTSLPPDIGVHIDPDREVARVHAILLSHLEKLSDLVEICQRLHLDRSLAKEKYPNFHIEDRHTLWETLKELKLAVLRLEQDHKQYMRRVCVRTIYGSEMAPIGDDNYLLMLAKHYP